MLKKVNRLIALARITAGHLLPQRKSASTPAPL
jgi:hypothetical protein